MKATVNQASEATKIDRTAPPRGQNFNQNEKKVRKKHNLSGIIIHKEPYKVYNKGSPYNGNQCYKLSVVLEGENSPVPLFVYPNLVRTEILSTIQESQFIDKRYLFTCEKRAKGLILHSWKELSNEKYAQEK